MNAIMHRKRMTILLWLAILLALNVWILSRLFEIEYTPWMSSIEGAYIGISRWLQGNWRSLGWFPLWYGGIPVENAYPPLLHVLVAAVSQVTGITVARAYHLVTAAMYCIGPCALFWLVWRLSRSQWKAFIAGWIFSLLSPSAFLMPSVAKDLNDVWAARRIQALVVYGEGPHVTSITLLILALAAVHSALESPIGWRTVVAALSVAAVALTNWLGAVALACGILALALARKEPRPGRIVLIGLLAYAIAAPWIPPSSIMAVQRNAQMIDGWVMGHAQYFYLGAWLTAIIGIGCLLRRTSWSESSRFAVLFLLLISVPPLGVEWFHIYPLPQPNRYDLEMEVAFSIAAGMLLGWKHRQARYAVAAVMLGIVLTQAPQWREKACEYLQPLDITKTVEWAQARWLRDHLPGARIFATGSSRFWLNAFTGNAQLGGGFDQGRSNPAIAGVTFAIGSTKGDGPDTAALLKAYGVQAIIVGGERTRDAYHDYKDPEKFSGVLTELWRDGDDAIYSIPASESLAHVVGKDELVATSALDRQAVRRFAAALDRADYPKAQFRWNGANRAIINAELPRTQAVSVQVSWDPGWRAQANGISCKTRRDALGLIVLEPDCNGRCAIDLFYDGGLQTKIARIICALGTVGCTFVVFLGFRRRDLSV
jgi:hypothetical protein